MLYGTGTITPYLLIPWIPIGILRWLMRMRRSAVSKNVICLKKLIESNQEELLRGISPRGRKR